MCQVKMLVKSVVIPFDSRDNVVEYTQMVFMQKIKYIFV